MSDNHYSGHVQLFLTRHWIPWYFTMFIKKNTPLLSKMIDSICEQMQILFTLGIKLALCDLNKYC